MSALASASMAAALLALAVGPPARAGEGTGTTGALPVLTTAGAIRALPREEAARGHPVRLEGVLAFVSETGTFFFLQDRSAGIFVDARALPSRAYQRGQTGVLEGVTAGGRFAPQVTLVSWAARGEASLPVPVPVRYEELATGRFDSQRVELGGILRAVVPEARPDTRHNVLMSLFSGDRTLVVHAHLGRASAAEALMGLVGARVRLRGMAGGFFNSRGQMFAVALHVQDQSDILIDAPAPPGDPFKAPVRRVDSLLRFSPDAALGDRVRVRGVVTLYEPGSALYVSDGTGGVLVRTRQSERLSVGDLVDISGYPAMGAWTPVLEDATYRRIGAGRPPAAIATTAAEEAGEGTHDARLVWLQAQLIDTARDDNRRVMTLKSGGVVFTAELGSLSRFDWSRVIALAPGSLVRISGISVAEVDSSLNRPTSFHILLRTPDDVFVVAAPSWWTLSRLLRAVAVLVGLIAFIAIWVVILRRRVAEQTLVIRRQVEHEAALEQRYRDLVENATDVIFTQDVHGKILAVNQAAEVVTGFTRQELLGRSLADLVTPAQSSDAKRLLSLAAAAQTMPPMLQWEIRAKDGRTVALEVSTRLIRDERSRVVAIEGVARDVTARKRAEADLAAANQRLVEISRRAGMAEVASSVLHNVGNVLNSVNVSVSVLSEALKRSKIPNLARAVALLRAHEHELVRFLTEDERGKPLASYLVAIADHLAGEHASLAVEVEQLARDVEHIKQVVAMQQGYARVSGGAAEPEPVVALVEDALRMQAEGLARHGVELVRDFRACPTISVEKHKILQILVNLISNASHACRAVEAGGRVTVSIAVADAAPERVAITVADNGVGIAPEHLTRIFEHGFTTRKDGHGFGLHSAALTARELGGTLAARSEGPGRGAAFTLEVPLASLERGTRSGERAAS